jgi:hypothetical protein
MSLITELQYSNDDDMITLFNVVENSENISELLISIHALLRIDVFYINEKRLVYIFSLLFSVKPLYEKKFKKLLYKLVYKVYSISDHCKNLSVFVYKTIKKPISIKRIEKIFNINVTNQNYLKRTYRHNYIVNYVNIQILSNVICEDIVSHVVSFF